eukprot:CAMPEP_0119112198 /NCGR_PEP_ID=MMETSP1180-20130426/39124_1 /TAXON_ID=3052 ORGANISM="Chlamydomonas cf sp, Strain CCMP681" /NCGR_SAMPLE_ID=MMETSP1180 /ASSEMBLY_ACC=CAM_ASM_000741 /LENGTH=235 /DNA_ID=CAMNT_0007099567 /DNA_START=369 /DNA_END=1076 /DNA_ORIENTATION=+
MAMNRLGFIVAMVSVVSSGMQQILCGMVQRKHNITSTQLLSNTAPVQGFLLMAVGPFIDKAVSGMWPTDYQARPGMVPCLIVSCLVAVLVNVSQFMCLGRLSALTFQVLGHAKTVMILMIGWLFFHDSLNHRKLVGMGMAVAGMVAYGYLNSRQHGTIPPIQKVSSQSPLSQALTQEKEHLNLLWSQRSSSSALIPQTALYRAGEKTTPTGTPDLLSARLSEALLSDVEQGEKKR